MQKVLLPFFLIRLVLSLLPFLVQVLLLKMQPRIGLFFFLLVTSLYLVSLVKSLENITFLNQTKTLTQEHIAVKTALEEETDLLQQRFLLEEHQVLYQDNPALSAQHDKLLRLLTKAPTHRDLLLNLAVLEATKGNLETTQGYLDTLEYADPNTSFLK